MGCAVSSGSMARIGEGTPRRSGQNWFTNPATFSHFRPIEVFSDGFGEIFSLT
jgi:hypothetical protein